MTTTRIIDGRGLAERLRNDLTARLARTKSKPGLAVVQVGDNPESSLYVSLKERAAAQVGIRFEKILLPATASQEKVIETIRRLNGRADVHGIVVQLPLPGQLQTSAAVSAVALQKDVDGLHPEFQRAVRDGKKTFWLPALPSSILALLDEAPATIRGAAALVLAHSDEFRTTMTAILQRRGACVRSAPSLDSAGEALRTSDIVITALGTPRAIAEADLKYGATLIDAGIIKLADGSIAGDFAGPAEPSRLAAYSPVPGGVGPVTVATLLDNTVRAFRHATRRSPFNFTISPVTLMWLVPTLALVASWSFFGGAGFWGRLLLFAAFGLASLLWLLVTPRRLTMRWWKNPDLWFLAYLALAAIGTLLSPALKKGLEEASILVVALLAFQLGRAFSAQDRRRFALLLVAGGVALAVWSLWLWISEGFLSSRVYGPFKNPDGLGPALIIPLLLGIGFLTSATRRWQRALAAIAVVLMAGTLILTAAVSAFAGILLSGIAALILFRPKPRRVAAGALFTIILVILAAAAVRLIPPLQSRVAGLTGLGATGAAASFRQRVSFVRSSLAMARDHPVFGVGLGVWSDYFPRYQRSLLERTELAHGTLPTVLAELGILGVVAFLALLLSLFGALLRAWQGAGRSDPLLPFASTGLAAAAIAGGVDVPWFYPGMVLLFWFTAGAFLNPIATPIENTVPRRRHRALAALLAVVVLGYGGLRFATSYYVDAADRAAQPDRDFIDALATAELAMGLFPTPSEELKMSIVMLTKSWSPADHETLLRWADTTLRDNPLQPAAYLLRGRLAANDGDRGQAERLFLKGLEMDPHFVPDLAADLAALYLADGRNADARGLAAAQLDRTGLDVPERNRSLATIADIKARAELALGERDAAKRSLEQALTFQPENEDAKKLLETEFKNN
ncbi:MAG: O-antigen ligase family protein [Candidatus Kerfeldbacteria bacterium]|nr:O-antigen ligase family protein [Candidatus Kerfeldbacteria bacterium]